MGLAPLGSDPGDWKGTYIEFRFQQPDKKRKTDIWHIVTQSGDLLGEIRWYTRWRKYAFYPNTGTLYENICLGEIAAFIEARMVERRTGV